VFRFLLRLIAISFFLSGLLIAAIAYWLYQPIELPADTEINVLSGSGVKLVANQLVEQKILFEPYIFSWGLRLAQRDRKIKAGVYIFPTKTTRYAVINQLLQGSNQYLSLTIIAGSTFNDLKMQLQKQSGINAVTTNLAIPEIAARLPIDPLFPASNVEGIFAADTFYYASGVTDLTLLRIAHKLQVKRVKIAWGNRDSSIPLQTPYELLTLASIVEKETGHAQDRDKIAGVFSNRLQINMRLQSDPTTIYGMGSRFDGNLRRVDLETDTPYNTYTRAGLTPTPICFPSNAVLQATAKPAKTNALYFVGKGNGRSYFSSSLDEHNAAVNRYQRSGR